MRYPGFLALSAILAQLGAGCGGSSRSGGSSSTSTFCAHAAALDCGLTYADCMSEMGQETRDAQVRECMNEYNAAVSCISANSMTCSGKGTSDPQIDYAPMCSAKQQAYQDCLGTCGGQGGTDSCSMDCKLPKLGEVSASCSGFGSSLSCTCSGGARDGRTFQTTTCNISAFQDVFYNNCF